MKRYLSLLMGLLMIVLVTGIAAAQDATEEPAAGEGNLESVTADTAAFEGQEVTLEGRVVEILNVRAFVLGEGAALDDDQVLVINNSDYEFDLSLTPGAIYRVTGIVHFSVNDDGMATFRPMNGVSQDDMESMATPGAEATDDMMVTPDAEMTAELEGTNMDRTGDMMMDVTGMFVPDRLRDHTIIEVTSADGFTLVTAAADNQ